MLGASAANLKRLSDGNKKLDVYSKNIQLNEVSEHPYLGLQLDNSLKWNHHIMKLCKNVSGKLAQLNRLRSGLGKNTLKQLYTTIIQPSLDYAISIWGYCSTRS